MEIIFWISLLLVVYTYVLYPLVLLLLSLFTHQRTVEIDHAPDVTFVVPSYNTEEVIATKLESLISLDYPREKLEIIVVSDCSTDRSDEIVRNYADKGIKLIRLDERQGKHFAQGEALKLAKGEVIVFTDATIQVPIDSLKRLISDFHDARIGCVSSVDRVRSASGETNAEGVYIRYDMLLRKLETATGSCTGMSGSYFAARRELCEDWRPELSNDFYLAMIAVMNGLRAIVDPGVVGYYSSVRQYSAEFKRKVRTIVHGLDAK
jgi:cellulose synthase/poly-beta-1,6-N-acetylglucosamine synthase-like glycosyltransferase